MYRTLKAVDWNFLPDSGGLLDQDDLLFDDLVTVSWREKRLEGMLKAGDIPGAVVRDFRKATPNNKEPSSSDRVDAEAS